MGKNRYAGGSTLKKKVKLWLILLAVVVAVAVIFVVASQVEKLLTPAVETSDSEDANQKLGNDIRKTIEYNGKTYYQNENIKSYLLIGTDVSGKNPVNQPLVKEGYVADMADFMVLLVCDAQNQCWTVLQLDRNTMTNVSLLYPDGKMASEDTMQLCTAFFYGHDRTSSSENTVTAVSKLLKDTPIAGYAAFTNDVVKSINHLAGGVTVTLEDDLSDRDPALTKGATVTLSDKQADLLVKGRMNVDDGSNAARMARQRIYLTGLLQALTAQTKADAKFPQTTYDALTEKMTTDLKKKEVGNLALTLLNYENHGIKTLEGKTELGTVLDDGKKHEEFYPDETSLIKTVINLFYTEK